MLIIDVAVIQTNSGIYHVQSNLEFLPLQLMQSFTDWLQFSMIFVTNIFLFIIVYVDAKRYH